LDNLLPVPYSLKKKPHVTEYEAKEIWLAATKAHVRLLIKVLWYTGFRISEALQITPDRLVKTYPMLYSLLIISGKKRRKPKERVLPDEMPIPQQLGIELEEFISDNKLKHNQKLFPSYRQTYWRQIRSCAKKAGLKDWDQIHPHSFRHGFVYDKASKGVHPYVLSQLARHEDLRTTLGYYQPSQDDLRRAIGE